ncbi:MAG: trypsin-like peptidase domain-containing protein [Lachnospiraceae bacterium]|nr:trypsin-like peptidase domain-containing protein [Lachnospiraceae bacterium]
MKKYPLICLMIALILTGCGKSEEDMPEIEESEVQVTVENMEMPVTLQETVTTNLVWVEAGNYCGSGYIWEMDDNLLVVTAAHVLKDVSQGVVLRLWDGYRVGVDEHFICKNSDLAFLKVDSERIPLFRKDLYAKASLEKSALDRIEKGAPLFAMGYTGSDKVCINKGMLTDKWIYVDDMEQYMILAEMDIVHGMSGGALLDSEGYCIGIISGKNEEGEIVAVPFHVITAELYSVAWS